MIDKLTEIRIKEAADTMDVVGEFCQLKRVRTTNEYTCACPLHNGQHLNHFKVNKPKNFYHCFVCGEHGGAIDFLMKYPGTRLSYPDALRWLAQRYSIDIGEEATRTWHFNTTANARQAQEPEPERETVELPLKYVTAVRDTSQDNFCTWLRALPWNEHQRGRLENILEAYLVGHSAYTGATIFWQVDEEGKVRTGKMMWYLKDGHRDKQKNPDWVTTRLVKKGMIDEDKQEVRRCLFGLHLVNAKGYRSRTVNIVESEKTAIVMATALGGQNGLWMATGGLQFLKREYIQKMIDLDFKVVLHPDHDGDEKWRKKMADYGFTYGEDYLISNQYVTTYWTEADGPKADAADIIVRRLFDAERTSDTRLLADLIRQNPTVQYLRETFKLITKDEKQYPEQ